MIVFRLAKNYRYWPGTADAQQKFWVWQGNGFVWFTDANGPVKVDGQTPIICPNTNV